MEQWKPIPGYEGLYEASSLGQIRTAEGKVTSSARFSHRVWKQRVLKPKHPVSRKRQDDRVSLWKNGKVKDYLVSHLVAMAWYGLPPEGFTVNHINGDWRDNRAENLEWLSLGDNIRHAIANGLNGQRKSVLLIPYNGKEPIVFFSMAGASEYLGRNHGYVSCRVKRHHIFAWSLDGRKYRIVVDEQS